MFEPVPDDISSHQIPGSRFSTEYGAIVFHGGRGRSQCSGWAWISGCRVGPCPLQVTHERSSRRNLKKKQKKSTQQELAGLHVQRWCACRSGGVTRALPPCAAASRSLEYSAFSGDTCARRSERRQLERSSSSARVRPRREDCRDKGGSLRKICRKQRR